MTQTLASKISFKKFCNVLEEVTSAARAKKCAILETFFQQCRNHAEKLKLDDQNADISLYPILRLILPSLERERGPNNLKQKSLANLYVRVFCLGKDSADANKLINYKSPLSKKFVGNDFAEKASFILRSHLPREGTDFTLERVNLFLDEISDRNETVQRREDIFKLLMGKINAVELKWITRIILKDMRLGVGTKAVLHAFHRDANSLFEVTANMQEVCEKLHNPNERFHYDIRIFFHFKPMLLERLQIENAEKVFAEGQQYFAQLKYDGERSQMHMKDGRFKYFTRQGYDITNNSGFGDSSSSGFLSGVFSRRLNQTCMSIILDGELMGWHKTKKEFGSKGMSFDVKKLSENSHHQPCFVAFDIILYNDVLLVDKPYEERLKILENAIKEEEGSLMLCKSTRISNSNELRAAFSQVMKDKEEGIVLKKCDVLYKPNVREHSGCYKIKAEYSENLVNDIDLIILGGYYGDGKYMGLIKSFLMGVASPPEFSGGSPEEFLSVVSVSNGLSMEALKELRTKFESLWIPTCPPNVSPPRLEPPDLWIRPEDSIILRLRATEMTKSNDYPTGYSLRFPRVIEVRVDKPWYNVCTTTELLSLVKDTRPIQKLVKREPDEDNYDIDMVPDTKIAKRQRSRSLKKDGPPVPIDMLDQPIIPWTRLLEGKEICVINGDDDLPKESIQEILRLHRAKVVQNPSAENYCVIIGNDKTARASNILRSQKYDVVSLDWFQRITKEENWSALQDFYPWDLLCCRESTKIRLAENYDKFYDSFSIDADVESLQRSFDKAKETASSLVFNSTQMRKIDEELFEGGVSTYSLFRDIVGYFDDQSDCAKYEFRFMAGTIKEELDDSTTHAFINGSSRTSTFNILLEKKPLSLIKIVNSEWIMKCFQSSRLVPIEEYLIN